MDAYTNPTLAPIGESPIARYHLYIPVVQRLVRGPYKAVMDGSSPPRGTTYFNKSKGDNIMITKGKMIKELKKAGIRRGDKNGASVHLEALKFYQVINLYYTYIEK